MDKQIVKIIILSITALVILSSGWYMYQRLNEQQKAFETDIYASVPSFSNQVINISRSHYFDELYRYNNDFEFLIGATQKYLSYPIIISIFKDSSSVLLSKVNREQSESLNKLIKLKVAAQYSPKKNTYRGVNIEMYSLPDNQFLSITTHNGIFAASRDYKTLEYFIDTDSINSYFKTIKDMDIVEKHRKGSYISISQRLDSCVLIFDYKLSLNKDIILDGYVLPTKGQSNPIHLDSAFIDQVRLPKHYGIDSCLVNDSTLYTTLKIMLNKMN